VCPDAGNGADPRCFPARGAHSDGRRRWRGAPQPRPRTSLRGAHGTPVGRQRHRRPHRRAHNHSDQAAATAPAGGRRPRAGVHSKTANRAPPPRRRPCRPPTPTARRSGGRPRPARADRRRSGGPAAGRATPTASAADPTDGARGRTPSASPRARAGGAAHEMPPGACCRPRFATCQDRRASLPRSNRLCHQPIPTRLPPGLPPVAV